ncbi:MAG: hypothetical protein HZB33_06715 [Nitrospirae bacterium]|nr:hypothetical protein [Nitrospirota bacterium]
MPLKGFSCKQCGNCCLNLSDAYATRVGEAEIKLWEEKGRSNILDRIAYLPLGEGAFVYDIWFSPVCRGRTKITI